MANFLDTKNKRKSAAITGVLMSLLIVGIFFVGLKYLDPPEEYGIAVNFGTSNVGKGDIQPTEPLKSASQEQVIEEQQEEIQEISESKVTEEETSKSEDVVTQDTEEAIAIKKEQEAKRKADAIAKKAQLEKERIEKEKQDAIAKQKAEEQAKKKKLDALIGGVSNSEGNATGGEGNDNVPGDKGKINGDPYAPSYFGNGGSGNGVGYGLNGRGKPSKTTFRQDCNEYGLVVVRIEVDRLGNVIKMSLDLKNTRNDDPCLVETAKKIASTHKWPVDNSAPRRQIGFISINFEQKN